MSKSVIECFILGLYGSFSPLHLCWVNLNLSTVVQQLITNSNYAHTSTQITVLINYKISHSSNLILLTIYWIKCYLEDFSFSYKWLFSSLKCNTSIFDNQLLLPIHPSLPPLPPHCFYWESQLWTQVQVQISPRRGQPTQSWGSGCPAQPPQRLHVPDGEQLVRQCLPRHWADTGYHQGSGCRWDLSS